MTSLCRTALSLCLLAACGDDQPAQDLPDAGAHVDAGNPNTPLGEVFVLETRDRGWDGAPYRDYGSVLGIIRKSADPVWHREVANDGTCRQLEWMPAQCDQYCDGVCVSTNVCQPYPKLISVGTLSLSGLEIADLHLSPVAPQNWYYPADLLPEDIFADDAVVRMSASGSGDMPAFSAATHAVPRLVADIQNFQITLHDQQDFVVKWTPAGDRYARVSVVLNSNNSGHGFPYDGIIECEAYDDAAEIRIPGSMIARFPETEDWEACAGGDCPRSWIRRSQRSYAQLPGGRVRLEVGSQIGLGVVHHHE